MCLLKIIDNPMNDIALVTVLRSMIGGFNDNELIKIRMGNSQKSFYESMCDYKNREDADEELKDKIEEILTKIEEYRKEQEYLPLNEFIWKIYLDTGYYSYVSLMPNGVLRASNLKLLFEKAKQYEKTSFKGLYNFINFIDKLTLSSKDMSGAKLIGENENVVRIMSIHKSKGLEFPVVFLSGMSKQFNMMDININSVLLHQDLGIGPKYINYEEGESYNTLAREAIKIKSKLESLSEEMRVLYVALTRAKEKLIITGIEKDYKRSSEKKEELLNSYEDSENKNIINKNVTKKFIKYLDWLELVYIQRAKDLEGVLDVTVHKKQELLREFAKVQVEEDKADFEKALKNVDIKDKENVKAKLDWEYGYITSNTVLSKASVTKIKNMKLDLKEEEVSEYKVPEFLKKEEKIGHAEKGILMHLILQKLDIKTQYDEGKIKEFVENLESRNIITEAQRQAVDISKVYNFTKSFIWKEMKFAKEIQREKPFYINIPAKEVYGEDIDEDILVQGIIDLYYITEDDRVVLVDYKTDKVDNANQLVDKYIEQLKLYKQALERSLSKKVDKTYIYSMYLDCVIEIS